MRFSKVRLISSSGLLMLGLFILASMLSYISLQKSSQLPILFLVFVFICDSLIFVTIVWGLTAKVELTEDRIEYKSVFKKAHIDWSKIESYGVYVTGSNVKYILDKEYYYKFIWGGQKFIYLTEQKDFSPAMFRRRPKTGYIDFHFNKEAFEMIESKINILKRKNL